MVRDCSDLEEVADIREINDNGGPDPERVAEQCRASAIFNHQTDHHMSTYLSLHYHIVFSTKHREPVLAQQWRERLFS